jgi:hypothetical protein
MTDIAHLCEILGSMNSILEDNLSLAQMGEDPRSEEEIRNSVCEDMIRMARELVALAGEEK